MAFVSYMPPRGTGLDHKPSVSSKQVCSVEFWLFLAYLSFSLIFSIQIRFIWEELGNTAQVFHIICTVLTIPTKMNSWTSQDFLTMSSFFSIQVFPLIYVRNMGDAYADCQNVSSTVHVVFDYGNSSSLFSRWECFIWYEHKSSNRSDTSFFSSDHILLDLSFF